MFKEFLEEIVKEAFNPSFGLFKVVCVATPSGVINSY